MNVGCGGTSTPPVVNPCKSPVTLPPKSATSATVRNAAVRRFSRPSVASAGSVARAGAARSTTRGLTTAAPR